MNWFYFGAFDTNRLRIPLYLGLLVVLVVFGYFVVGQLLQLQQVKNFHKAQIALLREIKHNLSNSPDYRNHQQHAQEKIDHIYSLVALPDQVTQVAMTLSKQMVASGLQIKLFQPATNQPKLALINFQVFGTYRQFIEFLQARNGRWPLNSVEELNIVPETSVSTPLLISGIFKICVFVDQSVSTGSC